MSVPALRFKEFSASWNNFSLRDIAVKIQDGTHFSPVVSESGEYKYLTSKNVKNGYIDLSNLTYISEKAHKEIYKRCDVKEGDVLLTKDGTIGQVCVNTLSEPFSLLSSVAFIRTKHMFSNYFLYHLLLSPNGQEEINKSIAGQALKRITLTKINSYIYSFPSFEEQTKIANFLTAVDEKITQLTQKYELLTQYKKGVMHQIFSHSKERSDSTVSYPRGISQELRFKDDDGQDFPDWEEATLGEVAKFRRGSFPQPYGLAKWYDDVNGMPFIQVFDVSDNFKLKNTTKRRISKEAQQQSVFVKTGSILITIQGSIGRIAVTQYDAYVDRTLLLFESFKVKINKQYFAYILFLLFEIEKGKAPGGIIKTITKEVLTDFKVFISDYEEQTKIANFLTAIDDKITATKNQLQAVKQYKQGLLQQMFVWE